MDIDKRLAQAERALGSACLGLLFTVMLVNVLLRYLLDTSLFWAEEVALAMFVWMGFLAAAATSAEDGHIRVTMLVDRLPPRLRQAVDLLMDLSLIVALTLLVAASHRGLDTLQLTVALRFPEKILYAIVPVTMALCVLHVGVRLLRRWRGLAPRGAES